MHVFSVYDLDHKEAIQASMNMRRNSQREMESIETIREAVSIVGGRLSYLSRVSKARNILEMANHLKDVEKGWLLSRIGLIEDCDDDVMDEVRTVPEPTLVNIEKDVPAKMEFMLLASPARVCKTEKGTGRRTEGED
jgi:hypothetical protein